MPHSVNRQTVTGKVENGTQDQTGNQTKRNVGNFVENTNIMTHAGRHIIETYAGLFEGLNAVSKLELLERLAKSIRKGKKSREKEFCSAFGAFASDKPAEEIAKEIRESRRFRKKDLKL